eukprot:symbB.v1.2.017862.t1/scaffold1397.1/size143028/9
MAGIVICVSGLPGAMGHEVSQACLRRGMTLAPVGLTGPSMPGQCQVKEGPMVIDVMLVGPEKPGAQKEALEELKKQHGHRLVIIDFTHPTAVNPNAELYASAGVNFVFGTTGGDRDALMKVTQESGVYAVIAPNMGKQIVALQATMERMAKDFPGAFSGYKLEVTESHQKTKADTSGTAKAMVTWDAELFFIIPPWGRSLKTLSLQPKRFIFQMLEEDEFSDGELDEENEMALFEMLKGDLKDDKVGTTESTKDAWDSWLSFAGEEKPPEVGQVSPAPPVKRPDPVVPTVAATTALSVTKVVASGSVTGQELIPGDEKMMPADPEEVEKDEDATEIRDTPTSQVAVAGQKASKSLEEVVVEEVQASEEEEVDLEGEMELFRHLKVPAVLPSSTNLEASVKGETSTSRSESYADMEIVSTASDEGMEFLLLSDEDEVEVEPPPPPPKIKVASTAPERKRKAATLEPYTSTYEVAVGDTVKIIKAAGGKEKLEGILATEPGLFGGKGCGCFSS